MSVTTKIVFNNLTSNKMIRITNEISMAHKYSLKTFLKLRTPYMLSGLIRSSTHKQISFLKIINTQFQRINTQTISNSTFFVFGICRLRTITNIVQYSEIYALTWMRGSNSPAAASDVSIIVRRRCTECDIRFTPVNSPNTSVSDGTTTIAVSTVRNVSQVSEEEHETRRTISAVTYCPIARRISDARRRLLIMIRTYCMNRTKRTQTYNTFMRNLEISMRKVRIFT